MKFSRVFCMPNAETFSMKPVRELLARYISAEKSVLDPFARNNMWGTVRNDIDPTTSAEYHMEAEAFCLSDFVQNKSFDVVLFDPPHSPRQISECYKGVGLKVGMKETQSGALYKRVRDAFAPTVKIGGHVISFGWHSNGMGIKRAYMPVEILLVQHGGAHNDTICLVEQRLAGGLG